MRHLNFVMVYKFGTGTVESSRAAAYVGIIFCQFMDILSRRTDKTIFTPYLFTNPQLWGSWVITGIAISLLFYVPSVSIWFGFGPLSLNDIMYPIIGALTFLSLFEGWKILRPRMAS